jgi:molybdenum cofactor cytidylyltransferase
MTIVILAAGASRRMGRQKLLLPVDGRPMIAHAIEAASAWPTVVVAGNAVALALAAASVRIIHNDAPERGMTHSLALANAAIDANGPIAVVLADVPDVTAAHIAAVVSHYDDSTDVVVPRCANRLTHPVVFGPRARRNIAMLPDGDTIKLLRDDPELRRRIVDIARAAPNDIDTPSDYARRIGRDGTDDKSSP